MASECFCGCGRKVPFGRKRVTNLLGARLEQDIEMFQGSIERTPDPAHDADLDRLVTTGAPLRDKLRDVVHGTLDRDDYPREDGRRWLEEAGEHRKRLAMQAVVGDFAGWSGHTKALLLRTGIAAPAVVADVRDTGTTINDSPRVELTLRVQPAGEEPFELKRKLMVSRVKIPRVGEPLTVFYDADDRSRFTFANDDVVDGDVGGTAAPGLDPVEQIARLAKLRNAGVLSEDEFAQGKARLLAGL
jgi:hypothetical protein